MLGTSIFSICCVLVAAPESGELGVKVERNVPVEMRDGVILRADVYRPDGGGPYPVLVKRTPYGKSRYSSECERFAEAGYLVVNQDVRGRYESDGKWESSFRLHTHDAEDGYDTVEWAAKLPGSTGKVGTFGMSYASGLQWRLAPLRPPSLVAMSAWSVSPGRALLEPTGTLRPFFLGWFVNSITPDMRRRANRPGVHTAWEAKTLWTQGEAEKWINFLPRLDLPREVFEDEAEVMYHRMKNPHIDSAKLDGCKEIMVPNLSVTGWYDGDGCDTLFFQTMVKEAKTEVARKASRIIIGPWLHRTLGIGQRIGEVDFGPKASLDTTALKIRWFDYWLKGRQNGVDKDPPVKIFVTGDNRWRDEQHWPLRRTKDKTFFLTSGGHANTPSGDGRLVEKKPAQAGSDHYVYNPNDPVPSLGDMVRRVHSIDPRPLADRKDVLVYQSEPLTERVEVTGNPVVELFAATSAPDTDWFVRLIDVAPDGVARNVCGMPGAVRARYREGFDKPKLLEPGEVVKYTIRMNPTSNAFLPGHRIRLDVTSSDFPNYDRNHNTAADQNANATLVSANQTVHHGGARATQIILPCVPNPRTEPSGQPEPSGQTEPSEPTNLLHTAAADGDLEQVKSMISKGVDLNAKDEMGRTALHRAVAHGHKQIVEHLLAEGADVNAEDIWKSVPLHCAATYGQKALAELLIAKGSDVNAKGARQWVPLHSAATYGHRDVVELLIRRNAEVDSTDENGLTPLHYAALQHHKDIARLLLGNGADANAQDQETGFTPLHYAAMEGHRDVAEVLLANGADANKREHEYGFRGLHHAARFGRKEVAELLLAKGADVDAKDKWGRTPLHVAAHHDRRDVAELLIANGAEVNAKSDLGRTPLDWARERRNKETVELLKKHGAEQ